MIIKRILSIACVCLFGLTTFGQGKYNANKDNPFGQPNPNAPKQIKDYANLIGINDCKSYRRGADGKFKEPVDSEWRFRYVLNGTAVQDQSWKSDGSHATSIRLFDGKKGEWHVTFFATKSPTSKPSTWSGGTNKKGDIVLTRPQKAPNGTDGFSKLTFYEISKTGFRWKGEWIDSKETIAFTFWRVECKKRGN